MITIGGRTFELVLDHKGGWNPEAFRERYSEVLDRYDYVIGDWGYNQLRLKGFYRDDHPRATKDTAIGHLVDYLQEYCNFGCSYFVLRRVQGDRRSGDARDLAAAAGEPLAFTHALPAEGEAAAAVNGEAAPRASGERLMRWRAEQSTGREGRALRIAAERAELEALVLQRELREQREAQEQQRQPRQRQRNGQPHKSQGHHAAKLHHSGAQHGSGQPKRNGQRAEARGGHGAAAGKGARTQHNRSSSDVQRSRQQGQRGETQRGPRPTRSDRPHGEPGGKRRTGGPASHAPSSGPGGES